MQNNNISNEHLEVVKWTIKCKTDEAFCLTCEDRNSEAIKWLIQCKPADQNLSPQEKEFIEFLSSINYKLN